MGTLVRPPRTGMEAFNLMPEGTFCQLINDVLVMSPSPTTPHARIQNIIFNALYELAKQQKVGEVFCAPLDVYLNNTNAFQPDILFISNERKNIIKEQGVYGAPDLVIEVLSKGTREIDLGKKKDVYKQTGAKEYWVVNPETKWCEGFVLEGDYKSLGEFEGTIIFRQFDLKVNF